jgi:hypothetical protein
VLPVFLLLVVLLLAHLMMATDVTGIRHHEGLLVLLMVVVNGIWHGNWHYDCILGLLMMDSIKANVWKLGVFSSYSSS